MRRVSQRTFLVSGVVAAIVLAGPVGVAAASSGEFAGTSDTGMVPVPPAVLESLEAGGASAQNVAALMQTEPDGSMNAGSLGARTASEVTFGQPVRFEFLELDRESESSVLTIDDIVLRAPGDETYIAITYVAGVADGVVDVRGDGRFSGWAGGADDSDLEPLATVSAGEMVIAGGPFGDRYVASADLRYVRAFNDEARAVIGAAPVSVTEFREVKAAFDDAWRAEHGDVAYSPQGLLYVGGAGASPDGARRPGGAAAAWAVAAGGLALTVVAAGRLSRARLRTPN